MSGELVGKSTPKAVPPPKPRDGYVGHDELVAQLREAVGFLYGLAAGMTLWGPSTGPSVAAAINDEAERLRLGLPGEVDG